MHLHEIIDSVENLSDFDVDIAIEEIVEDGQNCHSITFYIGEDVMWSTVNKQLFAKASRNALFGLHRDVDGAVVASVSVVFAGPFHTLASSAALHRTFWLTAHEFTVKAGETFKTVDERFVQPLMQHRAFTAGYNSDESFSIFPAMGIGPAVKETK